MLAHLHTSVAAVWSLVSSPLAVAALAAAAVVLLTALVQGATAILRFRRGYADAVLPQVPAHGLVIVTAKAAADEPGNSTQDSSHALDGAASTDHGALRLLLIGDSLAVGAGQSHRCTPVLAESMARVLSRELGGRPVYWTCHGESGASTRWITRMLRQAAGRGRGRAANDDDTRAGAAPADHGSAAESGGSSTPQPPIWEKYVTEGAWAADETHRRTVLSWCRKLHRFQESFDPKAAVGPYDMVVILTGANDLKGMLFPFLLLEEDKQLLAETKNETSGVVADLQHLMAFVTGAAQDRLQELNRNMEDRVEEYLQSIRDAADAVTETLRNGGDAAGNGTDDAPLLDFAAINTSIEKLTESLTDLLEERAWFMLSQPRRRARLRDRNQTALVDGVPVRNTTATDGTAAGGTVAVDPSVAAVEVPDRHPADDASMVAPWFVLPGMPARALPAFRRPPIRWFAVATMDFMDRQKRRLAQQSEGRIGFVADPPLTAMRDHLAGRGAVLDGQRAEQVLLAVRAVSGEACDAISRGMQERYGGGATELRKRLPRSSVAASLFSVDQVHPNERGYDFWGRSMGLEMARQWRQRWQAPAPD